MSATPPHRFPFLFRVYYAIVVLGAAALLVQQARAPGGPPHAPAALLIGAFVLLCLSELAPIALPGGGYVTASTVFNLPCLILVGPFWTSLIDLVANAVVHGAVKHKSPVRIVHNMAIYTLGYFATAWTYTLAGGVLGSPSFPRDGAALFAAGVVFFGVNSVCVSTVIGLTAGPNPWRVWQRNFQQGMLHHLSFVALGALVAVVYASAGPWGIALFALPFLVARYSFQVYLELKSDMKDFVRALTEVLEEVDPYTRHHSHRVSQYAVRLARGLGRPEREVEEVEYAALVHDIGKIGPQHQHILQKPGSLSHEEQRTLRAHPGAGAEIVARVRALRRASEIVRAHHERPDGQGYPYGLRSEDVPLGARILNVADAFDAMTSDRPYRRALPLEAALRELERGAGTQFDREVVRCLLRLHREGEFPLVPSPSSEDLQLLRLRTRTGG
ncbi:MAG TPA: HD-GYP domain-containing protein [Candidatus Acidoferrales bacterium]|nr:HD-GYP domain-containing protein [Candidatus Acidoferrales bacterium]